MRSFVALLGVAGRGIDDATRRAYESVPRRRGLSVRWRSYPGAAVMIAGNGRSAEVTVAEHGSTIVVGSARLDNRADIASPVCGHDVPDLALCLRRLERDGAEAAGGLLGDFAFVVWNSVTRTALAVSDAFSVRKLYWTERGGFLAFASRAELLSDGDRYEASYLARLLSVAGFDREETVYAGVRRIPDATVVAFSDGTVTRKPYWSPWEHRDPWPGSDQEAADECRHLLATSIRRRVEGSGGIWAQLSGGMDSSSLVSLTQWLALRGELAHGLAGTVTFVDRQDSTADERRYSDTVLERWRPPNIAIVEPPLWYDEAYPPTATDQPRLDFHVYPRDRRLIESVAGSGSRVLLTGRGGDELFTGNTLFLADWVAAGRLRAAGSELLRRAVTGRVSFWELALRNVAIPLLPAAARERLLGRSLPSTPWLRPHALRRLGVTEGALMAADYAGPWGGKHQHAAGASVAGISQLMDTGLVEEELDVRHPFLYRPLVEFALRLPPELCARPYARKWVLRQAMRGILPETVRTRIGKAAAADVMARGLSTQRELLAPLVRDPILAELGIVEPSRLRAAFDDEDARSGRNAEAYASLSAVLCVEAWLQIRSARWPSGAIGCRRAVFNI